MKPIDFSDEPGCPGYGPADITLAYQDYSSNLNPGVTFSVLSGTESQTISGERLLKAAVYLIQAYLKSKGKTVEVELKIKDV